MLIELKIDGVIVYTHTCDSVEPTPVPTPTPTPPPPSPPPASGPVFAFPEGALYPVGQGITASGDAGIAIPFISNDSIAPLGILLHFVDQKPQPTQNEWNISTQPHDFTPMQPEGTTISGATGVLALRFGRDSVVPLVDCALQPNRQYYLNLRDGAIPRGTVSSQLWWQRRTDS